MTSLKDSIIIKAPLETIEAIALDANRLPEWYAGMQESTPDETYPEVGGTVDTVYKAAGMSFKMKIISTELIRGQSQTLKMEGMITGTNQWTFAPQGEETRVTCTFEYEMPGGGIGKALDKLVIERMNAENLKKSLKNLKKLSESGSKGV